MTVSPNNFDLAILASRSTCRWFCPLVTASATPSSAFSGKAPLSASRRPRRARPCRRRPPGTALSSRTGGGSPTLTAPQWNTTAPWTLGSHFNTSQTGTSSRWEALRWPGGGGTRCPFTVLRAPGLVSARHSPERSLAPFATDTVAPPPALHLALSGRHVLAERRRPRPVRDQQRRPLPRSAAL